MKADLHLTTASEEKGMGEERPILIDVKLIVENPCRSGHVFFRQLLVLPEDCPAMIPCHDQVIEFQNIAGVRRSTFHPHAKGKPWTPSAKFEGQDLRVMQGIVRVQTASPHREPQTN